MNQSIEFDTVTYCHMAMYGTTNPVAFEAIINSILGLSKLKHHRLEQDKINDDKSIDENEEIKADEDADIESIGNADGTVTKIKKILIDGPEILSFISHKLSNNTDDLQENIVTIRTFLKLLTSYHPDILKEICEYSVNYRSLPTINSPNIYGTIDVDVELFAQFKTVFEADGILAAVGFSTTLIRFSHYYNRLYSLCGKEPTASEILYFHLGKVY